MAQIHSVQTVYLLNSLKVQVKIPNPSPQNTQTSPLKQE